MVVLCLFGYKGGKGLYSRIVDAGALGTKKRRKKIFLVSFRLLTSDLELLGEGTNLLAVQEGPDAELGTLGAREGIHAGVGTIVVVGVLCFYVSLLGALDLDFKVITTEGLLLLSLIERLDGEGEYSETRVGSIGTFLALDLPGRILDVFALEIDSDVIRSRFGRVKFDIVGAVVVVLDVGVDGAAGALDLDFKVITTIGSGVAFGIDGMNGECARLVIDEAMEGGTLSP